MQRFTVELERVNVYRATVTVEAANLSEARVQAMDKARIHRHLWTPDIGAAMVKKITAHAKIAGTP